LLLLSRFPRAPLLTGFRERFEFHHVAGVEWLL
jgi:hypothetical protein